MKKVFSVLMVASVLSLVACKGNKTEEAPAADSTKVEVSTDTATAPADTTTAPADTAKTNTAEGEKKAEEPKEAKKP